MTSPEDAPNQEPGSYTPPQDTGAPDAVETDPLALNSAEDLDEDRLRLDPLEAGMDPPERWVAADKYGMTPYEQAHSRRLSDRLAEEQPDTPADPASPDPGSRPDQQPADLDAEALSEAIGRGQAADEAGGSVTSSARHPTSGNET